MWRFAIPLRAARPRKLAGREIQFMIADGKGAHGISLSKNDPALSVGDKQERHPPSASMSGSADAQVALILH